MKEQSNNYSANYNVIPAKPVFTEDNKVFVKGDTKKNAKIGKQHKIWYPINFQWIPVLEIAGNLNHSSVLFDFRTKL